MKDTLFIRLLHHEDKAAALAGRIAAIREGVSDGDVYAVDPESFRQVPNTPFCYWVSERIRRLFQELPPFESEGRTVKQGLATADDFRFVRAWWEVPAERILDGGRWSAATGQEKTGEEKWTEERIREFQAWCRKRTYEGKRWVPFAKGGEYSPYYADIHLVVNWENDGTEIRNFVDPKTGKTNSRPQNTDYYFRPGLTWGDRTSALLSVRPWPSGGIFSVKGSAGFFGDSIITHVCGLMNSLPFNFFLEMLVSAGSIARSYQVGIIGSVPFPEAKRPCGNSAIAACRLRQDQDRDAESSHVFTTSPLLRVAGTTLTERATERTRRVAESEAEIKRLYTEINDATFDAYGFTEEERKRVLVAQFSSSSAQDEGEGALSSDPDSVDPDELVGVSFAVSCLEVVASLLSWCVGVAFGRWDIRFATGERQPPPLPDPFDPLPVCPPGMLQGPDGLPAEPEDVPADYPLRIDWDGILVDDPEHEDDIVRRVRDVLEVIWKDLAEAIEKEACEILGVKDLRDYFRKPGKGGFWDDHVKRYSKSRRKAPIYWYLRSTKGNYGLWLYYHRLDKDILFKALLNYVEPKIRLEEDRLNALRSRKEAAGTSGREAKQIEKEIDRQEQFVSELHDFKDKLRRAADLHITPDLNDGVVLNIAPLWELVPWKEAKKYWEELQEGKYDWAHIALELWPERVKEKCRTDRSIAIAHGLEQLCEVPPPKARRAAANAETPDAELEKVETEDADDEAV